MARDDGTAASYGYDGAGRLTDLTQGAASGSPASIQTLTYNPASQLLRATQATAAYVWQAIRRPPRTMSMTA